MVVSKMSAYEKVRLKRLKENEKRLKDLGLIKLAQSFRHAKSSPTRHVKPKILRQPGNLMSARRSSRIASKPHPRYNEVRRSKPKLLRQPVEIPTVKKVARGANKPLTGCKEINNEEMLKTNVKGKIRRTIIDNDGSVNEQCYGMLRNGRAWKRPPIPVKASFKPPDNSSFVYEPDGDLYVYMKPIPKRVENPCDLERKTRSNKAKKLLKSARFTRRYSTKNNDTINPGGSSYYFVDEDFNTIMVGTSSRRGTRRPLYMICPEFHAKFSSTLPVGSLDNWLTKKEFEALIHKLTYSSFGNGSITNYRIPWFIKKIGDNCNAGMQLVPCDFQHLLQDNYRDSWILIQSGWKTYPIELVGNRTMKGWKSFWNDHSFKVNFTLMFGAEREWIFDMIAIDQNGDRVPYPWTDDIAMVNVMPATEGRLATPVPPSTLVASLYRLQFGHYYVCADTLNQELFKRFRSISQGVMTVWLSLGHVKHRLEIENDCFEQSCITFVIDALKLKSGDFIFVTISDEEVVKVMAFDGDGVEKRCFWDET